MKKLWQFLKQTTGAGSKLLALLLVAVLAVSGMTLSFATTPDGGETAATAQTEAEPETEEALAEPDEAEDAGDADDADAAEDVSEETELRDAEAEPQTKATGTVDTSKINAAVVGAEEDPDDEDNEDVNGDGLHADGHSDDSADVETAATWEQTLPEELTGVWADDLIAVAESQLGYHESRANYRVNDMGKHKGYSRYGAWYGDPYGDWCAMFVSFCLHYAEIPTDAFPHNASCWAWTKALDKLDMYETADSEYIPVPGDLVFFDNNSRNHKPVDHVGIVTEIVEETDEETGEVTTTVMTIEGNSGNMVHEREYDITDSRIVGYGVLPENPNLEEEEEEEEAAADAMPAHEIDCSLDERYIGEADPYAVSETDDFFLIYQVAFAAAEDLEAGEVKITLDPSLGTYRDGTDILPTDLGIPYGTPGNPAESADTPFNYYDVGDQLVIWNYRALEADTTNAFLVRYQHQDIMRIPDGTSWSLTAQAAVGTQTVSAPTLTGSVHTMASVTSATREARTALDAAAASTPHMVQRVSAYIDGDIPEPYASAPDDYVYIVWRVTVDGSATQPYMFTIDDRTFGADNGSVVGYRVYEPGTSDGVKHIYRADETGRPELVFFSNTEKEYTASFDVVKAYPLGS